MTSPLGNAGKYSKAIVAIAGAGTIALEQIALTLPSSKAWVPVATSVIAAVVTYLVPNTVESNPPATPAATAKQSAGGSEFPS